ncbi:hypothetical protein CBOM_08100 [Ceraceosorus bombacis]|uniref:Uncharacterized protein n=1 Tax=Ceraceosorus bombacis TaxID=401625 RepID=A0A0P1BKN0_9BASI|nr:hypothetical protein CBOM_08100 [Ceraceosorus bombacis]
MRCGSCECGLIDCAQLEASDPTVRGCPERDRHNPAAITSRISAQCSLENSHEMTIETTSFAPLPPPTDHSALHTLNCSTKARYFPGFEQSCREARCCAEDLQDVCTKPDAEHEFSSLEVAYRYRYSSDHGAVVETS